ncbi:MAG: hypothetical protein Q4E75_04145 [bacterium]|nr:hypothetical protein [bacterium]
MMDEGMDKIDIYNDSAIILDKTTPKKIISWITILIFLTTIFIIISLIPLNTYKTYIGTIKIDNGNSYILLNDCDFPIKNNNYLYIKSKKYFYKVENISDGYIALSLKLENNIKINNNKVLVNILDDRTSLYKVIKNKIKKGLGYGKFNR